MSYRETGKWGGIGKCSTDLSRCCEHHAFSLGDSWTQDNICPKESKCTQNTSKLTGITPAGGIGKRNYKYYRTFNYAL